MDIRPLDLQGLAVLTPRRFGDDRGWFSETWNRARMAEAGFDHDFVQDNHSLSAEAGTLRGLHYQAPPFGQAKLVRCSAGRVFDVAVDVRRGSPGFGQWRGAFLTAAGGEQMLVPAGFLHGFLTLTPGAEVQYKVDAPYSGAHDGSVAWDDPDIAIDWPLAEAGVTAPILSDKDAAAPGFADWTSPFDWTSS